MPAYLTHYTGGITILQNMHDSGLKQLIQSYSSVYRAGLAGPDIFFYSVFDMLRHPGAATGRVIHKYRCGQFLQALYAQALSMEGRQKEIALVYLAGFTGHFCMDACTHPLVYRICDDPDEIKAMGKHFRYEAAMDVYACEKLLSKSIREVRQIDLIRLTRLERKTISHLMGECIRLVYPERAGEWPDRRMNRTLSFYRLINELLWDPSGFHEWLFLGLERAVKGYPMFSPLFLNANRYHITEKEWQRFKLRYDRGLAFFERSILMLERELESGAKEPSQWMKVLGNRDYHTGLKHDPGVFEPLET